MTGSKQQQRAKSLLRRLRRKPILRITGGTAEVFAMLAARLLRSKRGTEYRLQDLWLAAQAVERGFTLLTANVKDFEDLAELEFIEVKVNGIHS